MNDRQLIIAHLLKCECKNLEKKEVDKCFQKNVDYDILHKLNKELYDSQITWNKLSKKLIERAYEFIKSGNIKIDDLWRKLVILQTKLNIKTDTEMKTLVMPKNFKRYFEAKTSDVWYYLVWWIFTTPNDPFGAIAKVTESYIEMTINKIVWNPNIYLTVITNNKTKFSKELDFLKKQYNL